jgi:hypothetical protein
MPGKWFAIAKAEFFVQTSRFRRWRKEASILLLGFGIIWALWIVPMIMPGILASFGPSVDILLQASFPSLMRSVMLFLWVIVLVYPISYALQEIRIGQWEIMLSNNVSTRSMMFGFFLGRVPSYGLFVLFLAPIMLTPFAIALNVSLVGQAIMYLTVFFVALSTLFLSTLITTAIQAKLGESSRGNDIAKALSMVVAIAVLIPMYGLIYFADAFSSFLGLDVFLLFPFTWGADIISWTIIIFNGLGISADVFLVVLKFDALIDLLLLSVFTCFVVLFAFRAADRIFSFGAGPRTEKIVTIHGENYLLRKIRGLLPGPFGVMVVTSIKEFSRKMQNVSRLVYGVVISVLLPVILSYSMQSIPENPPEPVQGLILMIVILIMGMMVAMISGITFGGIGFLESRDQLWIIKSAPGGVWKFAKARLVESLFLAILIVLIPTIAVTLVFRFGIIEFFAILLYSYWSTAGAVLISIGITANNPTYEDQKSAAFMINTFASVFLVMIILMVSLFAGFTLMATLQSLPLILLISSTPMVAIGAVLYIVGIVRMSRADTV